jgi:hypothetical protein
MWRGVAKAFLAFAFAKKQRSKHWPRCALSEKNGNNTCGFGRDVATIVATLHKNKPHFKFKGFSFGKKIETIIKTTFGSYMLLVICFVI